MGKPSFLPPPAHLSQRWLTWFTDLWWLRQQRRCHPQSCSWQGNYSEEMCNCKKCPWYIGSSRKVADNEPHLTRWREINCSRILCYHLGHFIFLMPPGPMNAFSLAYNSPCFQSHTLNSNSPGYICSTLHRFWSQHYFDFLSRHAVCRHFFVTGMPFSSLA